MQRFRGGFVFKAHRLCASLNSRLESNKEEEGPSGAGGSSKTRGGSAARCTPPRSREAPRQQTTLLRQQMTLLRQQMTLLRQQMTPLPRQQTCVGCSAGCQNTTWLRISGLGVRVEKLCSGLWGDNYFTKMCSGSEVGSH